VVISIRELRRQTVLSHHWSGQTAENNDRLYSLKHESNLNISSPDKRYTASPCSSVQSINAAKEDELYLS
jgi:hypothetical protein